MSPDIHGRDTLFETLSFVSRCGKRSSLIPLFLDVELISRALDHYRPDIVHFCEGLCDENGGTVCRDAALNRQHIIRERFPEIRIMRSIPIGQECFSAQVPTLEIAGMFESISDFFLTDTLVINGSKNPDAAQPVSGFIGITGKVCDWGMAAKLVSISRIPVLLAGGISPENAGDGFTRVKPAGVDSCTLTNVFDENGKPVRFRKDIEKVKRLVAAVRRAEQLDITETEEQ
jgi:phosphoribosylanthranilate isomerase